MPVRKRNINDLVTDRFKLEPLSPRVLYSADVQWLGGIQGFQSFSANDDVQARTLNDTPASLVQKIETKPGSFVADEPRVENQSSRDSHISTVIIQPISESDESVEQWLTDVTDELKAAHSVDVLYLPVSDDGNLIINASTEMLPVDVLVNAQAFSEWQNYLATNAKIITYSPAAGESTDSSSGAIDRLSASERSIQTLTATTVEHGVAPQAESNHDSLSLTTRNGSAAIFTVTNLNDSGAGSFREALDSALNDNDPAPALIRFDVSGTIALQSALPVIQGSIYIDAYHGAGVTSGPRIIIDAGHPGNSIGLNISNANDTFIQGVGIINANNHAISIQSSDGVVIQNNFIGNDGDTVFTNDGYGVFVFSSRNVTIEGNVISGNVDGGINASGIINGEDFLRVYQNMIGLDRTGQHVLGNGGTGISLSNVNNVHIGLNDSLGNYIGGNTGNAINLRGFENVVFGGNVIGVTSNGLEAVNTNSNIVVSSEGSGLIIGFDAAIGSDGNTISNSENNGISITGSQSGIVNVRITGNYIGTDTTGSIAMGNLQEGIRLSGIVSNVDIGEPIAGGGNVISANGDDGIFLNGGNIFDVRIDNNHIGLSADGLIELGNAQAGFASSRALSDNTPAGFSIGSIDTGSGENGNAFAGNHLFDIRLNSSVDMQILSNTFGELSDGTIAVNAVTAIEASGNVSGLTIGAPSGGNSIGAYYRGIRLDASNATDAVIQNNVFGQVAAGQATNNMDRGVLVVGSSQDVTVQLNQFHNAQSAAVFINQNTSRNTVINNTYHGVDGLFTDLFSNANDGISSPAILAAEQINQNTLEVSGVINANSNTTYRLEVQLLEANVGDGSIILGTENVQTNGSGVANFTITINSNDLRAGNIVASITQDSPTNGLTNSSEFSMPVAINVPANIPLPIGPITDVDISDNSVDENSVAGSTVGITAQAADPDAADTVTYSLSVNPGGLFEIGEFSGVITTLAPFDAETDTSFDVTVEAESSDGTSSTHTFTIVVNDVNEHTPDILTESIAISEGIGAGTQLIQLQAIDADVTFTPQQWSIVSGNDDGSFWIDPQNGWLYVSSDQTTGIDQFEPITMQPIPFGAPLDAETAQAHTLLVTVSDGQNVSAQVDVNIAVTDEDEFDVTSISDSDSAPNTVSSTAQLGTAVGITAFANDDDVSDNVTYSLDSNASGRFDIDTTTGVVFVDTNLSADAGTIQTITVEALSDDGSVSLVLLPVAITGDIGPVVDSNLIANSIDENRPIGSTVGIIARAVDPDATDTVTYSLLNPALPFEIDNTSGLITTTALLDAEATASYSLAVVAESSDGTSSSASFQVVVNDVNEFTPQVQPPSNNVPNIVVAEDVMAGTVLGQVQSTDGDVSFTPQQYTIVSGNVGNVFQIDPTNGNLSIAPGANLDAETLQIYLLEVTVSDGFHDSLATTITIGVDNVNEHAVTIPIDVDTSANTVAHDAGIGSSVGVIAFAEDEDVGDDVSYILSNNANGRFDINQTTGEITTAASLVADAGTTQTIEIEALSDDGSVMQLSVPVTVTVNGGIGPLVDSNSSADSIDENSPIGSTVGITALAIDPDAADTVTYSLDNSQTLPFEIDQNSGVITTTALLDAEATASYSLTVVANSSDGTASQAVFPVVVNDVNEFNPQVDPLVRVITEDTTDGTFIGQVQSSDGDISFTPQQYTIVSGNDNNAFQIDPSSGDLFVAVGANLDAENQQSYQLFVTVSDGFNDSSPELITVVLIDVNEHAVTMPIDVNISANTVAHDAAIGSSVGVMVFAEDEDINDNVSYVLSNSANGRFGINPVTGEISTAASLVADAGTTQTIEIDAISDDGSVMQLSVQVAITAGIGPLVDSNPLADSVDENLPSGSTVGITALAIDPDAADTVTYSLFNGQALPFEIDQTTGVITTTAPLDAEATGTASYSIPVVAESSDGTTSQTIFQLDVGDVNEFIPQVGSLNVVILENTAGGTLLGQVPSSDGDIGTAPLQYAIVSGNDNNLFQIDPSNGNLSVAVGANLDSETQETHQILVTVSDGLNVSTPASSTIVLTDVNEHAVSIPIDVDASANSVAPNAAIGSSVGVIAFAEDEDVSDNVSYVLSNSANGRFGINPVTGEISTAASLVADAGTTQTIEIDAISDDGSVMQLSVQVAITAGIGPVVDSNPSANSVNENSPIGSEVGITALAIDPDAADTVTYSLANPNLPFEIDQTTGVITTTASLDTETTASYIFSVVAESSDGSSSHALFQVVVGDVNEFIPQVDPLNIVIPEDTIGGTLVGQVQSSDDDAGFTPLQYSIVSGNDDNLFHLDPSNGNLSIAVGANLDTEAQENHDISVTVSDGINVSSPALVTVTVTDVNEHAVTMPVDADISANTVAHDAVIGSSIGIMAFSEDEDLTDNVSYSLSNNANGRFEIDTVTGEITTIASLVADAGTTQTIEIEALSTDGSTSSLISSVMVTAPIGPMIDADLSDNSVDENSPMGSAVGITVEAVDPDAADTVSYSLSNTAGGRFSIDATSGVISTTASFDAETDTNFTVTAVATSSDGTDSIQNFTIEIIDVNEFTPEVIAETITIPESTPVTTQIADLQATDDDRDFNPQQWMITSGNDDNLFQIDAANGQLFINPGNELDSETTQQHVLMVSVSDGSNVSNPAPIIINVTDVNEHSVTEPIDTDPAINTVSSTAGVGTAVGFTAFSTDEDISDSVVYGLVDSANGRFSINPITGELSTAISLEADAGNIQSITVSATSSDGSVLTLTETVAVTGPVDQFTDIDTDLNTVDANAAIGSTVGVTVFAADPDPSDTVTYSIIDVNSPFSIDPVTGVLTTAVSLEGLAGTQQNLFIEILSSDGSRDIAPISVYVSGPIESVIDANPVANEVSEELPAGSVVGITAQGIDPDVGDDVTYQIIDSTNQPFSIDPSTGVVSTNTALDFESESTHQFTVIAESSDGSTSSAVFTVNVGDVNDQRPVVQSENLVIPENSSDISIATLQASDNDGSSEISDWRIDSGNDNNVFSIDPVTGVLSITPQATIDHEANAQYELFVSVSDGENRSESTLITITIEDENESPIFEGAEFETTTEFVGQIGQIEVTDPDSGDTHTFTLQNSASTPITLTPDGELFQQELLEQGAIEIPVQVVDSGGASVSGIILLNVVELESGPTPETAAALPADNDSQLLQPLESVENIALNELSDVLSGNMQEEAINNVASNVQSAMDSEDSISGSSVLMFEESQASTDDSLLESDTESNLSETGAVDDSLFSTEGFEGSERMLEDVQRQSAVEQRLANGATGSATELLISELGNNRRLLLNLLVNTAEETNTEIRSLSNLFVSGQVGSTFSPEFINALQSVNDDFANEAASDKRQEEFQVSTTTFVSSALTVGFVTWLLQSGSLVATAVTTAPLWQSLDPIPVLVNNDTDSEF